MKGEKVIPNKYQLNRIYMDLFGQLGESIRINEDKGKSRSSKLPYQYTKGYTKDCDVYSEDSER